ncbi:hypothetical protein C2R22_04170 [Salinigranum rubrum]|uniref:histidine kinase n=1 Tax=Salinigranum rubrum TaxID=755307 RepID=A0A2I8VG99_9EURY|nr:ATP-binding protein [Salinigranum rubrum]AUV80955.1 hypothetical protein C2R22_04170 [Salinigranum rubrum]
MSPAGCRPTATIGRRERVLLVDASTTFVDRAKGALTRDEPAVVLTTADPDAALTSLASADCLLLGAASDEHERTRPRAAFVETVRERDATLPVVVAVDPGDSATVDAVLAAGATDVVDPDAPDALLAARLRNALARRTRRGGELVGEAERPDDAPDPTVLQRELDDVQRSLHDLYTVTTDASLSLDERIERTLALVCDRIDVRLGFLTRIDDDTQRIVHAVGDHPLLQPGESCPLSTSYCRRTLEADGLLAVGHAAVDEGWEDDPGYELFGLECYLGGRVSVDGDLYGTLCFADTEPRNEPFTESQTAFVELLTRWVSYELERERHERDLQRATRRFRALFDNPRTFAGILDPDGTLREVNDTARSTLSDPDSAVGLPFWDTPWWAPDDDSVATVRDAVEAASGGEAASFECRYFPQEGAGTVSATIYPVYGALAEDEVLGGGTFDAAATDDAEVVSLMAVGTDTTTRTEQAEQLRRQRDRLEEFASVVSHDLRSPLEVARGRLHLYEKTGDGENLGDVKASLDRMSTLIDDLLDLARQGEAVSNPTSTSVSDVARRAWNTVATDEATLAVDLDSDLTVDADPSRLRQLFENLFRNSVEHGSTDGERVTIRLVALDDRRGFAVEDDGVGIAPDDREQVFERGVTTNQAGTGFGLAIVERVVEAHGWRIDVTESAAGGARFEVSFDS